MKPDSVAIIGAGPAGLTAAYLLSKEQVPAIVLESDPIYVGGIARTAQYKGYSFDIGGHRFFSKSLEVESLWTELLPDDMLERNRSSRIFYRGQMFGYPLKAGEALRKLGLFESARCVLSYARAKAFPNRNPRSFEDWVVNQFGHRLFSIFFKTYTEKVWGMSCKEISADWAAQRIKGLSLGKAIRNAIFPQKAKERGKTIKTLIDTFRYPRKGPGMLWEACAEKVKARGGTVRLGRRVQGLEFDAAAGLWNVTHANREGHAEVTQSTHVISSAPLPEVVHWLEPALSPRTIEAAKTLRYRDFLTVVVILHDRQPFGDNWIYIHDPGVKVGRIQNFKSWSPEMVPEPGMNCYGLEYFCFEGDGLWATPDEKLIDLAKRELEHIGLARTVDIVDGCVVRQPKAYPVYDDDYLRNVAIIREEIEALFPSLHVIGRNGMHKYNNQDHSVMTAMLTVRNILAGERVYDVWRVNQDAEYQEEGSAAAQSGATGLRQVPARIAHAATSLESTSLEGGSSGTTS